MKKQQMGKPFFSMFLERQMKQENVQGGDNPNVTLKHPSDWEDAHTMRYPSDSDEVTLAYPSDSDHEGVPELS